MKLLAIYLLEVLACSGVLLAAYAILLERRTPYRWCRRFLLALSPLAATIPLLRIPVWPGEVILATPLPELLDIAPAPSPTQVVEQASLFTPELICGLFYALGVALILGTLIYQGVRIIRLRRDAELLHTSRFSLVRTRQRIASFSFFGSIYIWDQTPEEEFSAILAHEASHIAHRHSIERIAIELTKATLWWNPFAWIVARRLTETQEFEADHDVLRDGHDIEHYMNAIFRQLFGYSPEIANGLRDSLTKKRFKMMTTPTMSKYSLLRLAATLPAMIGLLCAFSFTSRAATIQIPEGAEGAEGAPDSWFKQVILLNGKPASIDEVYRLDPACIDTTYVLMDKEVPEQYAGANFVHLINTKGAPRNGKLITLKGRVHFPDGKPAANFDLFAGGQNYIIPSSQAEINRLGAKSDAEGRFSLQGLAQGQLYATNQFVASSRNFDSKQDDPLSLNIEVFYPDSAKWEQRREANGTITLLPNRLPEPASQPSISILSPPSKEVAKKLVRLSFDIRLMDKDGKGFSSNNYAQGALIRVVNSTQGVVSDQKGNAKIEVPAGTVLEVLYPDYETTTLVADDQNTAHVFVLRPLSGQKPEPTTIISRDRDGVAQTPLYIIDGQQVKNIESIDAAQIEHISILKDESSTKRYGERGKNGVIVITTKSQAGRRPREAAATTTAATPEASAPVAAPQDDAPFLVVETMPKFQGGDLNSFRLWVQGQLKFPKEALDKDIQGRVVLSFVVERDGSISQIAILQSPDKSLSDEARRVIESSPKWTPGHQRGQVVRVKYTLPIDFRAKSPSDPAAAPVAASAAQ